MKMTSIGDSSGCRYRQRSHRERDNSQVFQRLCGVAGTKSAVKLNMKAYIILSWTFILPIDRSVNAFLQQCRTTSCGPLSQSISIVGNGTAYYFQHIRPSAESV